MHKVFCQKVLRWEVTWWW